MTASSPRPAAPDTTGELRDEIRISPDGRNVAIRNRDDKFSPWRVTDGSYRSDASVADWLNGIAFYPESSYTVEIGGQKFTQAQWGAVQTYAAGSCERCDRCREFAAEELPRPAAPEGTASDNEPGSSGPQVTVRTCGGSYRALDGAT